MLNLSVTDESGRRYDIYYTFMKVDLMADLNLVNFNPKNRIYATVCSMSFDRNVPIEQWDYAVAINSENDQYVKKIGMILSFSRVLKKLVHDKNLRKAFFNEFWNKHGRRIKGGKVARIA